MLNPRFLLVLTLLVSGTLSATPPDRFHDDSRDTPKLLFRPDFKAPEGAGPSATARAFLEDRAELFHLPEIDQIVLESHFGLGSGLRMPDLASATLDAAQALFPGGPHRLVFESHFVHHNILELPELIAPSLIFPVGGEELLPGSQHTVLWETNGAPGDATYQVDIADQCTPVVIFEDDMEGPVLWTATHNSGSVDWSLVDRHQLPRCQFPRVDDARPAGGRLLREAIRPSGRSF